MKLQINTNGAWRNVVEFPNVRELVLAVGDAAADLGRAAGINAKFRFVDDAGDVLGYCDPPHYMEWRQASQNNQGAE